VGALTPIITLVSSQAHLLIPLLPPWLQPDTAASVLLPHSAATASQPRSGCALLVGELISVDMSAR